MNFLAPAAFALSSLLAVITALYLLRLRRKEHDISSLYLWRNMVHDREASAPWQKLRFSWLLLLQLLFLAVLIMAAARPFTWYQGVSGQSVILILDSSASMAAVDTPPSRLDAARRRAQEIVNDLPADARVTVIEAGAETRVRVTSSLDRRQAAEAIAGIRAGSGEAELGMALELASAIASRKPDTQIVVLSDGRAPLPEHLTLRGKLNYIPVGLSGENQAVSLLNVEPSAAGGWDVFVQVANYGSRSVQRRLGIYAGDQLVNMVELDLAPGDQQAVTLPGLPADTKRVEARLEGEDILAADDTARSAVRQARGRRIALLSPGNLFLATALRLIPGVELIEVETGSEAALPAADLYVFDGVLPAELPGAGGLWFINPQVSTDLFDTGAITVEPVLRVVDPQDVLVKDVSTSGIHLLDARQIPLPDWGLPVIAGDLTDGSLPLLFRGEPGGRRVVVQSFSLAHSDLPLNVAFPVLTANIVNWLTPGLESGLPAAIQPGQAVELPAGAAEAQVIRPDGSREAVSALDGRLTVADTTQIGYYRVSWDGQEPVEFAVNLSSPLESDLKPAGTLGDLASTQAGGDETEDLARREWWRWLAVPALVLLMLEWLVYQRSGVLRLRDWLARKMAGLRRRPSQGFRS